ncbi:hypothetical protein AMATHDRAFT_134605 [Amanita thiersii Skay4041]|uniref:Uncharacterized protein n=1 Tax=Amanita thiersii Skay4041 TaxID=703135 RepID=A0A2A9P174_9AGAR|nr:hypothetical protein AMATHDRAFT_134605 [Amanita thiersii Skay4041]
MSKAPQPPLIIDLPVGSKLGWELHNTVENASLHSIPDSAVIVRSLRQSRERWLLSTFPKFSSKARPSKSSETVTPPPPHTIQTRGQCDLEIGPHIFLNTIFYEVHYISTQPQASWQSTSVAPYSTAYSQDAPSTSATSQPSVPTPSNSTPLTAVTTITPALINQVNTAASSNPILANLLQLAAAGKATPDQLKTLGLLIQSLASPDAAAIASGAVAQTQTTNQMPSSLPVTRPPVKPFDIVIEFHELPNERWLFPRGPATCERILDSSATDAAYDTILTTCIPFEKPTSENDLPTIDQLESNISKGAAKPVTPQVVKFRLKKAPLAVWDTLRRWMGSEQDMNKHQEYLSNLKPLPRVYLGYQLLSGSLLTQLQEVSTHPYPMRLIKPSFYSSRSKKKAKIAKELTDTSQSKLDGSSTPKQRRRTQVKKQITSQISCLICGNTHLPLILGGRYCRPCVEAGKTTTQDVTRPSQASHEGKTPIFIHSNYSSQAQSQTPETTKNTPQHE